MVPLGYTQNSKILFVSGIRIFLSNANIEAKLRSITLFDQYLMLRIIIKI